MHEDEAKAELKQLLTVHIGFSLAGICCLVFHFMNQI